MKIKKTLLKKQNKRPHNLETLKRIRKKFGILSQTLLLLNYGNISSLTCKHCEISNSKLAPK